MSHYRIQRKYRDEAWVDWWDNDLTLAQCVEHVRGYCIGPDIAFRVVEETFGGVIVAFVWGPLLPVVSE